MGDLWGPPQEDQEDLWGQGGHCKGLWEHKEGWRHSPLGGEQGRGEMELN